MPQKQDVDRSWPELPPSSSTSQTYKGTPMERYQGLPVRNHRWSSQVPRLPASVTRHGDASHVRFLPPSLLFHSRSQVSLVSASCLHRSIFTPWLPGNLSLPTLPDQSPLGAGGRGQLSRAGRAPAAAASPHGWLEIPTQMAETERRGRRDPQGGAGFLLMTKQPRPYG